MNRIQRLLWISITTLVVALLIGGCIPFMPSMHMQNSVDLDPLLDLDIPQNAQTLSEIFDFPKLKAYFNGINLFVSPEDFDFIYRTDDPQGEMKIYIHVTAFLAETEEKATSEFRALCRAKEYANLASVQGAVNNVIYRYCIPDLIQSRTGPDGIYPVYFRWEYHDMIVQKGRVIFTFDEITDTTDRAAINAVIKTIADATQVEK